jgi:hypothetical protein
VFLIASVIGVASVLLATQLLPDRKDVSAIGDPRAEAVAHLVASLPEGTSAEQQETVADGVVSDDELLAALERLQGCIIDGGFDAHISPARGIHPPSVGWKVRPDQDLEASRVVVQACRGKHYDAVGVIRAVATQPTEAELNTALRALLECIAGQGVEGIDPGMSHGEYVDLSNDPVRLTDGVFMPAYIPCSEQIEEEFGFPL